MNIHRFLFLTLTLATFSNVPLDAMKRASSSSPESWYVQWCAKNVSKQAEAELLAMWLLFYGNVQQDVLVLIFRELNLLVIEYQKMLTSLRVCKNSKKYRESDASPQILYRYLACFCEKHPIETGAWLLQKCLQEDGASLADFVGEYGHNVFHGNTGESCRLINMDVIKLLLAAEPSDNVICELLNSSAYCTGTPISLARYGERHDDEVWGMNIEVADLLQEYLDKHNNAD